MVTPKNEPEFNRPVSIEQIDRREGVWTEAASTDECVFVAERLKIPAVRSLSVEAECTLLDGSVTTSKLAALAVTTAKIAANAVSLGKLAQISTQTFLGRKTAGTGDVEALTAAEMRTELDVYNKSESDALGVSINTSPLQDITANTWVTYAHSIGSEPVAWGVNLVCKTASDGYAVGEKILSPLIPLPPTASGGGHYDSGAYVDDTNFGAILGTHFIQDKGTLVSSAITHANWQFEFWWIA